MEITRDILGYLESITPGKMAIYKIVGRKVETLGASQDLHTLNDMTREEYEEFTRADASSTIIPEDREAVLDEIRRCVTDKKQLDIYYRVFHRTRGFDWVHANARFCGTMEGYPVIIVIYTNASVESNMYQKIIDHSKAMIYVRDCNDYKILYANRRAEEMRAGTSEGYLGLTCYEYIMGLDHPCTGCFIGEIRRNGTSTLDRYNECNGCWEQVTGELINWCGHDAFIQYVHDVTAEKYREIEQKRLAEIDSLTGIFNRGTTVSRIREILITGQGRRCALLMLDLDDLKKINDFMGHIQGDNALKAMAETMESHFRSGDVIGRTGGDEFMIFMPEISADVTLEDKIISFRKKLSQHIIGKHPIQCSIGCAFGTTGRDDYETLYKHADLALYYVKKSGKNDFAFYVPEMLTEQYEYVPHGDASDA